MRQNSIMIVDDNVANIRYLGQILKNEGYRVGIAQDGKQALKAIPNIKPDLILLDVMMPGWDGFETCNELKKNPETKNIPVIFLTAKTENDDIIKGFEAGAVDYIAKPINSAELLARVKTHLELKNHRSNLETMVSERTVELEKKNQQLNHLLEEKEILLREVNHRVRNNLQFITSLLYLQSEDHLSEEISREIIIPYANRLQSMAIIHDLLYRESNYVEVDFVRFLQMLIKNLHIMLKLPYENIDLTLKNDAFKVNINMAIPCGLVLNELLSYYMKHIKEHNKKDTIDIEIKHNKDNEYNIIITTPSYDAIMVYQQKHSFENQLIAMSLEELDGSIYKAPEKENSLILAIKELPRVIYNPV